MKSTQPATIHVIARCADCPWQNEDYVHSEIAAKQHAKTQNHTVYVERAQTYIINVKE